MWVDERTHAAIQEFSRTPGKRWTNGQVVMAAVRLLELAAKNQVVILDEDGSTMVTVLP